MLVAEDGLQADETLQVVAGEVCAAGEEVEECAGGCGRGLGAGVVAVVMGGGGGGGFGRCGGRWGSVFGEPVAEEGEDEPVCICVVRIDALPPGSRERDAKQFRLSAELAVGELVDFVFDDVEDVGGHSVAELVGAGRPLADDVDEGFGEDDFGAGEVAEFEVGWWVFCDLFPEAGLELEEVVVDAGADDGEGIVHVREVEEGFALDVGFGDVEGVEGGRVVVEGAEEVVVVTDGVAVGVGLWGGACDVGGGLHRGEVGHGAEETAGGWRGRLVGDGWGVGLVGAAAEEGRWCLFLDEHGNFVILDAPIELVAPYISLTVGAGISGPAVHSSCLFIFAYAS